MERRAILRMLSSAWFVELFPFRCFGGAPKAPAVRKVVLHGEATAGKEWRAALGGGWVFRLVPVTPGESNCTGWDIVVGTESGDGFPDGVLLVTSPYDTSQACDREIGTTYNIRAQDAVGWSSRSFKFLTRVDAIKRGQKLWRSLGGEEGRLHIVAPPFRRDDPLSKESDQLMDLQREASSGWFKILDARLAPGTADPNPFAEEWKIGLEETPHKFEPPHSGKPTPLGELHWIRFEATLFVPAAWKASV
jgi:hypothetical protein